MGLILFGFITALMATIGRVDELPEPLVPTRYTPFACLLQIGVGLAAVRRLETLGGARKVAFTGAYVIQGTNLSHSGVQSGGGAGRRTACMGDAAIALLHPKSMVQYCRDIPPLILVPHRPSSDRVSWR